MSPSELQSQRDEVRQSLHETWKEIEAVRAQIQETKKSLQKLRDLEEELLDSASEKASLLSPFERLPQDVIGEIAGNLVDRSDAIPQNNIGIWALSHVCKTWRSAVISLPHLWASFSIHEEKNGREGTCTRPHLEFILMVLERSRCHALSFSLKIKDRSRFKEALLLLVKESERWKHVELAGTTGPSPFFCLHRRLPLLESLKLDLEQPRNGSDRWSDSEDERKIFEDAPKLVKFEITDFNNGPGVDFRFPVQQLRRVSFGWKKWERRGSWDLLTQLELRMMSPGWVDWVRNVKTFPSLKHLTIEHNLALLSAIRTPQLESLYLHDIKIKESEEFGVIHDFIDRISDSELHTLDLRLRIPDGKRDEDRAPPLDDLLAHRTCQHLHTLGIRVAYKYKQGCEVPDHHPYSLPWFLVRATYKNANAHRGYPYIPLLNLRKFTIGFEYLEMYPGIFDCLRIFITSRTRRVDKWMDIMAEDGIAREIPARLEEVCIAYSDSIPPITMEDKDYLDCGLVQLSE